MLCEALRQDSLTLDAELLEGLVASPEAPVSDAPQYSPQAISVLILSPKEPKEPKRPHQR